MILTVPSAAESQLVAGTAGVLSFTGRDSDGEPTDPGAVTVGVVRSDGTEVIAPGTATTAVGNARTVAVSPAQTAATDVLTATWTASGVVVGATRHDVVGAPTLTYADFVRLSRSSADTPTATFLDARRSVDAFMLSELHRSIVPRFTVERVQHDRYRPHARRDEIPLSYPNLRAVRWARLYHSDGTFTVIDDVADIRADPAGVARHDDWRTGWLEIGYEHGWDRPTFDAQRVWARLVRSHLGDTRSTIDDRATSYQAADGALITLGVQGRPGWYTDIPMVNEFITRNRWQPAFTGIA